MFEGAGKCYGQAGTASFRILIMTIGKGINRRSVSG
jgi:hypothetical protein